MAHGPILRHRLHGYLAIITAWLAMGSVAVWAQGMEDSFDTSLDTLSLEQLLTLEISGVSRIEESSAKSPAVVTSITQNIIRQMGFRTLWDILIHIPGFWEIQDVNDKLLGMRGVHSSTNQKLLLLVNGKRITENLWNLTDLDYDLSLAHVKRIDIIRSPGSAVYGIAALTAVIDVTTNDTLDGLQLDASVGTYGFRKAGLSFAKEINKSSKVEVWGHLFHSDGERRAVSAAEDGALSRIDGSEKIDRFPGLTGSLGANITHGDWRAQLIFMHRNYALPRGSGAQLNWDQIAQNPDYAPHWSEGFLAEDHRFLVADLDRKFSIRNTEHKLSMNYTHSNLRVAENSRPLRDLTLPASFDAAAIREYSLGELFGFNAASNRFGAEYFGTWKMGEDRNLIWGLEGFQVRPTDTHFAANYIATVENGAIVKTPTIGGYYREKPDGIFDRIRTEHMLSGYAELRWKVGRRIPIYLSLGSRYDLHIKGDDYQQSSQTDRYPDPAAAAKREAIEKTSSQMSPRIALVYQPFDSDGVTLKAIYNRSFIAPGYFYRYADPSTSYAGGPWLKAETLDSFIFDVEGVKNSLGWKVLYFAYINQNLLIRDTTLKPPRYDSAGKLGTHGVEAEILHQRKWVHGFANYTYLAGLRGQTDATTEAKWILSDGSLNNFPLHYGSVGVTGHALSNQLHLTVLLLWHAPYKSRLGAGNIPDPTNPIATIDSSFQTDVTLKWAPKGMDLVKDLDLAVSVYNLFDESIQRGGPVLRPYYKAGRWVTCTLIKKF